MLLVDRGERGVEVVGQVGLGEHEDRVGAGVPGQRLAALDPAGGDRSVEAAHEQHEVEVGGEELLVLAARGPAAQQRGPIQQAEHLLAVEGQPVADRDGLHPAAQLHAPVPGRGRGPARRPRRGAARGPVRPPARARRGARPSGRP